jgi:hypothetical protein
MKTLIQKGHYNSIAPSLPGLSVDENFDSKGELQVYRFIVARAIGS